ncbi:MAG TPA: ABC transporter ATP-binding protein [Plantibacter sp.]|uniref:ABC transporter ATP-binding protein n=1 Tax=Plantibacter sp. TaxID=1871045 RepID=UPI002D09C11E|nr:ABC transporter ATP-binding protein [Plantibacter sp.]
MASVTLSSVDLRYPSGTQGLAGIDLHVEDGEFVALLGPSGSGKTTLLRTVAGFLAPTSGRVLLGERVVAGDGAFVAPEHRSLGMVFQQHAVWPHWSVGRNVEYPLKLAKVPRRERAERVASVLELVGLAGAAKRDPATLSGGQRQRVALARAIVAEPGVLLLDEALSALDEPLRDRLRLELQSLTRRFGLTVIHVTHDRDEALALADRVVVLDGGRIQQVATPPELVSRPASAFVARFVSDATIIAGALVPGTTGAGGFVGSGHAVRIDAAVIERGGTEGSRDGAEVHLAILPEDVVLAPSGRAGDGDAVVVSSLFGREGNDVVVDWGGLALRSRTAGFRPIVGERVLVRVRRAIAYPGGASRSPLVPVPLGV